MSRRNNCIKTGQGNKPRYEKTLYMEINQYKEAQYYTQDLVKQSLEENSYIDKYK